MLSGVTLSGISGLFVVLIESWWARRNKNVARYGVGFAEVFSGPIGGYVVGFAALTAAVAFPLNAYWHSLYGIDVAIWAPFHIMFAASMGIVALGVAYMVGSAAHLAARSGAVGNGTRRAATLGAVLAVDTLPGFHHFAERGAAGRVHCASPSYRTGIGSRDSWLPGLSTHRLGRHIRGHALWS